MTNETEAHKRIHMGQIMAECDCADPMWCEANGKCRADLSDALVRAALEAAAEYHDEIYEHDMSGIEYSMLVGIPISNHADLEQSCKRAELDAKAIRAIADDPEALAAIKAKAGWAL